MTVAGVAGGISASLFAWYGLASFYSKAMIEEFDRYGLKKQRVLTGVLQVAGSVGLVVGNFNRPILLLSSGGLAVMMFLAVATRFKIRDPLYKALPAFSLCLLNAFVFVMGLQGR